MTAEPCPETVDTIAAALAWTRQRLEQGGIDDLRLESRLLVARALGVSPEYVFGYPERTLDDVARRNLSDIVTRRANREPMAYITGEREFWSLPIAVTPDTLIPRPDSETLIEAVLSVFPESSGREQLLDLGTGSGCLLLSVLHERPHWTGTGTDRSEAALAVAAGNALTLGLAERCDFIRHDWTNASVVELEPKGFDLVIANPPYIPDGDRVSLDADVVEYEPHSALFAGEEGLDAYRIIVPQVAAALRTGGWIFLEIGRGQAAAVSAMLAEHGYSSIGERKDLSGIPRCVFGRVEKQ